MNKSAHIEISCPAKLNLQLAVTGLRADGFHELVSVVACVDWGDALQLDWDPDGDPKADLVSFRDDGLPVDHPLPPEHNTVSAALQAFRHASGLHHGRFGVAVSKRIPSGAGLGGGSSDAVGLLRAIARVFPADDLACNFAEIAASVGSDCPLFLRDGAVMMTGRGEQLQAIPQDLQDRLSGRRVLLVKPSFGISTPEAYRRLRALRCYSPGFSGRVLLDAWRSSGDSLPPRGNDFERILPHWIPSLAIVIGQLRAHGFDARLTGSGSAFFLLMEGNADQDLVAKTIRHAYGDGVRMLETVLN